MATIDQLTAALVGRYEIEREIGAGGMASVYLARDVKHDRLVAVKVLHDDLAATLGSQRFLAEIKTTANLHHPHILPLHDSGDADGFLFYVMPYVEGEALRNRMEREKQLPVGDALRIATEVASALDYAHRHGVIHRDIKPENILLHDGQALVADFGIALAVSAAGAGRMTATGISLGTPQYMSPEQAMGEQNVTARADIFALGCVVYEMLVGEPPFTGPTPQAIVARVLSSEPRSIMVQRRTVASEIEAAVLTALNKVPADRFGSAAEFAAALGGRHVPASSGTRARMLRATRPTLRRGAWLGWALAAVLAVLLIVKISTARDGAGTSEPLRRLSIVLPDSAPLAFVGAAPIHVGRTSLALSPDGRILVYVGRSGTTTRLFTRALDGDMVTALPGTDGAYSPFFSPDGEWVAFFSGSRLWKVPMAGGEAVSLGEVNNPHGGAWHSSGRILVVDNDIRDLVWVPETGGNPQRLASGPLRVTWNRTPSFLPDQRWAIVGRSVIPLEKGKLRYLTRAGTSDDAGVLAEAFHIGSTQYLPSGHLLWVDNGRMYAVPFDPKRRRTTGPPIALQDTVRQEVITHAAQIAVARNGTAVYAPGTSIANSRLITADLAGKIDTLKFPRAAYSNFSFAPDGRSIAVALQSSSGSELWLLDLASSQSTRLYSSRHFFVDPLWRGGTTLVVVEFLPNGALRSLEIDVRGGEPRPLSDTAIHVAGISRDGKMLAVVRPDSGVKLQGGTGVQRWLTRDIYARTFEFSPDGQWVAWSSPVSKQFEVYVAKLGEGVNGRRVTPDGCLDARWMPDSRTIVCLGLDGYLYSVRLDMIGDDVRGEPPRRLPVGRILETSGRTWDLSRDGKRVLFVAEPAADTTTVLTVITNLPAEIRRRTVAQQP